MGDKHSASKNNSNWVKSKLSRLYEQVTAEELAGKLYEFYYGKLYFEEGYLKTKTEFTFNGIDYEVDFHLTVGLNGYHTHTDVEALNLSDQGALRLIRPENANKQRVEATKEASKKFVLVILLTP